MLNLNSWFFNLKSWLVWTSSKFQQQRKDPADLYQKLIIAYYYRCLSNSFEISLVCSGFFAKNVRNTYFHLSDNYKARIQKNRDYVPHQNTSMYLIKIIQSFIKIIQSFIKIIKKFNDKEKTQLIFTKN